MISNKVRVSIWVLSCLLAGYSQATCVTSENTSIPESTPTSNYSILLDGTLEAPAAGLMWKRCLEGQTLVSGVCEGAPTIYTWTDALAAANAATFAGHSDWRLPNPKELLSIIEDRCVRPALNFDLFPIADVFGMWSATPTALNLAGGFDQAWAFNTGGGQSRLSKYQITSILLVRDLP